MSLYEGIKDVAKVLQRADNVELYIKLIDLSSQALDLQDEISRLKDENRELRKAKELDERIVRHTQPYLTLKDEEPEILYCANCWGKEGAMIQMLILDQNSPHRSAYCHNCQTRFRV
ncbi:MAG: hypothetical protein IKI64_01855 [Clostridia bacterium]|nr:hypothetical protein [Clostridia bacterium]